MNKSSFNSMLVVVVVYAFEGWVGDCLSWCCCQDGRCCYRYLVAVRFAVLTCASMRKQRKDVEHCGLVKVHPVRQQGLKYSLGLGLKQKLVFWAGAHLVDPLQAHSHCVIQGSSTWLMTHSSNNCQEQQLPVWYSRVKGGCYKSQLSIRFFWKESVGSSKCLKRLHRRCMRRRMSATHCNLWVDTRRVLVKSMTKDSRTQCNFHGMLPNMKDNLHWSCCLIKSVHMLSELLLHWDLLCCHDTMQAFWIGDLICQSAFSASSSSGGPGPTLGRTVMTHFLNIMAWSTSSSALGCALVCDVRFGFLVHGQELERNETNLNYKVLASWLLAIATSSGAELS